MPRSNEPAFTPEATIGPFYPFAFTEGFAPLAAIPSPGVSHRPHGLPIAVTGRILDSNGTGVPSMIVESWQANAAGRYRHPQDKSPQPLDPSFEGFVRVRTDELGVYRIETVKPGAHASAGGQAMRAPHLRLTIFGSGIDRLVTYVHFADEPLNEADLLLGSLGDELRPRLLAARAPDDDAGGFAAYRLDIVLRGAAETPFFDDWKV
ncbi:protocatechuate 3,4-dioxygenase subunit alpha [Bosea sp. (in: a-proteobacteria)]|jgi:protocatechuate 3,4-dioxygenase alpha subunit|uniref:protocatechuate 3,4-dioxygenase subunit alpha n=1 Tax=Bosea sp. (in: a-proteobacteria) TaxID=1871050 RepID=UPI003F726BFE